MTDWHGIEPDAWYSVLNNLTIQPKQVTRPVKQGMRKQYKERGHWQAVLFIGHIPIAEKYEWDLVQPTKAWAKWFRRNGWHWQKRAIWRTPHDK